MAARDEVRAHVDELVGQVDLRAGMLEEYSVPACWAKMTAFTPSSSRRTRICSVSCSRREKKCTRCMPKKAILMPSFSKM